jgi:hypothetical protein
MKCRVVKGGWSWKGVERNTGDILDAPSDEWINNRIADGGLVERIADEPAPNVSTPIETAAIQAPENTTLPSQRASAKQRK